MPQDISEVFKTTPAAPPVAAPETSPAIKNPGQDVSEVFARQPKSPPLMEKVKGLAGDAKKAVVEGFNRSGVKGGLSQYWEDYKEWENSYVDALHKDVRAYPEGTGAQVIQSLKTLNDAVGAVTGPLMSPVYTGLINPIKEGIAKMGGLVEKHAAADVYDAQARREGVQGQQYPKSIDWSVHKADVQRTVAGLQDAWEGLVNAGVAIAGGGEKGALPEKPIPERPVAVARASVADLSKAVEPAEPKLTPVSVALDKTMGFGKVTEKVAPTLQAIPAGSTRTAAAVLDDMLPHAEGYAKSFLEKLNGAIDPTLPIKFKNVAGGNTNYLGIYSPDLNAIELKTGGKNIIHTAVHEMVHATTINVMDTLIEGDIKAITSKLGRELSAEEKLTVVRNPQNSLLKELDGIVKEARLRAQKAAIEFRSLKPGQNQPTPYGLQQPRIPADASAPTRAFYAMSPRYEFVAELFSNPHLQEFLATSEKYASVGYKVKNLLSQFGDIIGRHLGLDPKELSLLNQSLKVGSKLIELHTEGKGVKERHIAQIVARTDTGEMITKGDIQRATLPAARIGDMEGIRRAKTTMQISIEGMLRAVSPESLGRNAKLAAATIASRITEQMQRTAAWRYGSDTRLKFWRGRPDLVSEFVEKFEKGHKFDDPELNSLAERYRDWNNRIFNQDKVGGIDYEPRENYLYHVFEDSEGVANYFNRKYGSKWGDPKFTKDRGFELYKEAIAAGFKPRFDNPEDVMLARQHASDIAEMHIGILKDLEKYGLATLKIKGEEKLTKVLGPDGKMSLGIEKVEGNKQPPDTVRWRAPNGSVYWLDAKADVLMQNAFKSKSLWQDKSVVGTGFRGAMALKNTLVPIRLALSLFHPLHVTGIDIAAGMTRNLAGMLSGEISPVKAMGGVLRSFPNPFYEGPKSGWRMMQVWKGKIPSEALTAADATSLRYIVEGGMIPEMSSQYRTNARQNFGNAFQDARASFRQGRVVEGMGDTARATWHLPWATLSAIQAPIFEHWIPQLKVASYLNDVKNLLQRNPELEADDAARQLAFRKLAKSVDNRYGEMAYNTLFWKRWIKDLAVLNTLSLGWQLGFIREYGGGALDAGAFLAKSGKLQRIRQGQLDRPLFVASYTTLGAGVAGLMTWGMTGEAPQDILDYVSPRTGEKNADGTPSRVSTMFYSREFAALYKHMENEGIATGLAKTVTNKGSGLFGLMHEWATGVNSWGQEIRDPDGESFQKIEQTLAYTLSDVEPISMKSIQESTSEKPVKSGVLTALGFTPAPKYLTETKTQASIKQAFQSYVAPKMTPYEKAEYSKDFHALREAYQGGADRYGELLDKLTEKYELSSTDQRRLMRSLNSDLTSDQRMFMRLPWQEQKKLLDKMTLEERNDFLPHSNRAHVRNSYEPPK